MLNRTILSVTACVLFAMGCEQRVGYLNAISTKNVYARNVDLEKLPKQMIEAEDSGFLGIGVTLQDAVDKALEQGHGNLMLDTAIYVKSVPFFPGIKVRGSVVNVPSTAGSMR
jgi:hypothetical protein